MNFGILKLYFASVLITICISVFSQENNKSVITTAAVFDSLSKSGATLNDNQKNPDIVLSTDQALKFLHQRFHPQLWNDAGNPLRQALGQLIYEAAHPTFDSVRNILMKYPYDSLNLRRLEVVIQSDSTESVTESKDTTNMFIVDTLNGINLSGAVFPFKSCNSRFQGDSIKAAVMSLLRYLDNRDSTIINFTGSGKSVTPVWMNSKSGMVKRYWLKNELSDSVTIWIGNPSRNTIGLYLEEGVNFRRPVRQVNYARAKIDLNAPDNTKLLDIKNITIKPQYWKFRKESSFILSQAALSNWVKGGDNSISTSIDATFYADYNNAPLKLSSNDFIRLNLGFLKTGDIPLRKNLDLLETNSKLNHKAFGKVDFSAIMLFKTQVATGFDYSSEQPVLVSKFMNPAILTIGLGLDYQPNKTTSLNFSPLSYKGTFVTDTIHIDQTKYGIAKNRKSLNEPGASFMISNTYKPLKTVSIINRLQLFTNYIHNPQNVDVDWEMIADANLNWFTDVRLDTHLIFDDDTKTPELDKNKNPVLLPDGSVKKTARIQFKEIFGISFVFRF
jgi:Protein of unknown function (DUF3078)